MGYAESLRGLNATTAAVDGIVADFSGLENLEKIVDNVLQRLSLQANVKYRVGMVKRGAMSMADFDGIFADMVHAELIDELTRVREKAVGKARTAGAGSASSAVLRRMYKDRYAGNINIGGNRKRISSLNRVVPDPDGGVSGIRRHRTVKTRTQQIREYYGPDRGFILRILEGGRDVFYATPEGATGIGSQATYGKRGAMGPHSWFNTMRSDMEEAAQRLGTTLTGAVEQWIEQEFKEAT